MKSKNLKTDEGVERNAAWRSLSPAEQLADLNRRLGKGVGAKRQRLKLSAILNPVTLAVSEPVITEPADAPKKRFKKGNKK